MKLNTVLKSFYLLFATIFALSLTACRGSDDAPEGPWEQISSLPSGFRTHHSYAFGLNGIGYIVGGQSAPGPRRDFYSYDPGTDQWTKLDDYRGPARAFGIGDTFDGKAYFGFGLTSNGDYLRDLHVFDPTTNSWQELAECPCTPRVHPALVANNGKIYMGMGESANNANLKDWWEYDIALDTWEQKTDFPSSARHHPYQFSIGAYVYAGLGHGNGIFNDWYRYDPSTDRWTAMANLPDQGRVAGNQFSYNGKGYVISGDGSDHGSMETGEFWSYDPVSNSWEQLPSHPGKSRWAPSAFVIGNEVFLINGQTDRQYVGTGYKYQLD